jgi:hypothetical protein
VRRGCPVDCIHPTPDETDYANVERLYIDPEDQVPEEWRR